MGKRKSPKGRELPLFDLPLHADDEEADSPPGPTELDTAGDLPTDTESEEPGLATSEPAAPEPAAPELVAPLKDRLLAGLLDLGIQLLVVVGAVVAAQAMGLSLSLDDWLPFALLGLDFSFLYWFIPLAFWGQTPGMAWVGNAASATGGEPLTFGQTALRWIGAVVTLALAGLPLLLAVSGRSLTDRLSDSKTMVI